MADQPKTRLHRSGRVVLPEGLPDEVRLQPGTEMAVEVRGGALVLRPVVDDALLVATSSGAELHSVSTTLPVSPRLPLATHRISSRRVFADALGSPRSRPRRAPRDSSR